MFIGRRPDGTIYGAWSVRQWPEQEEMEDTQPELEAFVNRVAHLAGAKERRMRDLQALTESDPMAAKVVEVLRASGFIP